ncbi:MAG: hypothetical protein JO352_13730 [Chloroflexi bacterium]|nr:hypothetical protein [Chloroflexota bacterium]
MLSLVDGPFHSLSSSEVIQSKFVPRRASMDANINTLFNNLTTDIRNVSVAVCGFAFVWGATIYGTSARSPHQMEMGKTAMKASLVGVAAIVLAATLVGMVFSALGGGAAG